MKNDFCVDTTRQAKKEFLKKIQIPLNIALFLTGLESFIAISYFINGIRYSSWNEMGVSNFVIQGVHYLAIVCIFVSLITVIINEKPFSYTLFHCVRMISFIYMISSIVFPRLSGFETNYNILQFGNITLVDGNSLIVGLLLYILSIMIREGFVVQKEMEEEII